MTTGEKIAALRRAQGMSQEALADRLGISRQAVSKWEAGQAAPGRDNLLELSRVFGVSADELLQPGRAAGPSGDAGPPPPPEGKAGRPRGWPLPLLAIAGAALAALVAWCAVCTVWLVRLQAQVDGLPAGQTVVTVPQGAPSEPPALLEYRVGREYEPGTDTVRLSLRAVPRVRAESETAVFTVKGADAPYEAEAVWEGGAYTASLSVPVQDGLWPYLLLTKDGETRTEPVGTLDLAREFRITISCGWDGQAARVRGGKLYLDGRAMVAAWASDPDGDSGESRVWPVSGTATLFADGKAVATQALDFGVAADGVAAGTVYEVTAYAPFRGEYAEQGVSVAVEVLDNYGKAYAGHVEFPDGDG